VTEIKNQFASRPHVYSNFLRVLQSYKDGALTIEAVKDEISQLFEGHPTLLHQFSIFLPPASGLKLKKKEKTERKRREDVHNRHNTLHFTTMLEKKKGKREGVQGGEGGGFERAAAKYKSKKASAEGPREEEEEVEEEFIPVAGERESDILFEIIELLKEAGGSRHAGVLYAAN
jgi:hypothetical protein